VASVLCAAGPLVLLGTELWALTGGLHMRNAHGLAGLLAVHTPSGALFAAGVLSLCAGIFSMLPFPQFDGGQMLRVGLGLWRGEKSAAVYEVTRSAVLVAVIAIAVLADVLGVVG
jgi:membrane-associated protease RseP (regulator of RpoE activity)